MSKTGLWSQKNSEDKLNSETSKNKLLRYRLSPKTNMCLRAFLGPF